MLKKHYPMIIEQDADGVFIVECPVFKGCRSYGHTIDEALENIREAAELCIEDENIPEEISTTFIGGRSAEIPFQHFGGDKHYVKSSISTETGNYEKFRRVKICMPLIGNRIRR